MTPVAVDPNDRLRCCRECRLEILINEGLSDRVGKTLRTRWPGVLDFDHDEVAALNRFHDDSTPQDLCRLFGGRGRQSSRGSPEEIEIGRKGKIAGYIKEDAVRRSDF